MLPQDSGMKTLPFVWERDHIRFRRTHKNSGCEATDVHYMLFLLDTSGSIGRRNFNKMTEAIASISHYFCKQIQVAFMTFDHNIHLEFCFNCHDNDPQGRARLNQTIQSIQYRGGLTHTARAASACSSQAVVCQPMLAVLMLCSSQMGAPMTEIFKFVMKFDVCIVMPKTHSQ